MSNRIDEDSSDLRKAVLRNNIFRSKIGSGSGREPHPKDPISHPKDEDNEGHAEQEEHDEQYQEDDEEEYEDSPLLQLRERFMQCALRSANSRPGPTVAELSTVYADASKADLFEIVTRCAGWVCFVATRPVPRGQDASAGLALFRKWERCITPGTPHADMIVRERSLDELREMLAAAFGDVESYIDDVVVEGRRIAVIKADVRPPELGKDWW